MLKLLMMTKTNMPRWKKDATKFEVSVGNMTKQDGTQSYMCILPKPIIARLGDPDRLEFRIVGKKIEVRGV